MEGSGALFTRSASNGINGCGSVVFAVLSDTIVAASLPDFPAQNSVATQFYRYALPSSNMLTLTDGFGNATTFQRATAIPSSVMCPPVPSATPIAIQDNQPSDRSGLASDGTTLWYSPNSGGARALNPLTGATGPSVSFGTGQFQWMQAIQGSDFWITCGCGNDSYMQRRTATGTLVISFDLSDTPTNRPVGIRAASYDGSNLWVSGYQYDIRKYVLLKLNANVSPPTVLAAIPFDAQILGMAFKSGDLWILTRYVGRELLAVDPATGTVRATYALPRGPDYRGLTVLAGKLYALRANPSRITYDILPIPGL